MLFVGTYEHTIDAKGRLAVPRELRAPLKAAGGQQALYAVLMEGPTLCIYTEAGFRKRSEELDASERSAEEVLAYEQLFYSLARRLELDGQGRVNLPEHLIKMAGLGREVVVTGVKDHLEVHDRDVWNKQIKRLLAQKPGLLVNPRKFLRSGASARAKRGQKRRG